MMRDNANNTQEHNLQEQLDNFTVDDKDSATSDDDDDSDNNKENGSNGNTVNENHTNGDGKTTKVDIVDHEAADVENFKNATDDSSTPTVATERGSFWSGMMLALMNSHYFNTLSGRAASIFNPLRGLTLQYLYPISPFSPTTPSDEVEFKGTHEPLCTEHKTLYMVDSGLTFNSPYPLLLRPQRGVDLFLSFDFSARPTDNTPPFKEILLAEKWATKNNIPFPPIEETVRTKYAKEPVRECYIFKHPRDPYCPVILHFVIVNNQFRKFKAPGVPRTTEEELAFGNFPIFDDPLQPYSLYNFSFTHYQFERIAGLMEFNTKLNADVIKDTIAEITARKRQIIPRPPITLGDVARMKLRFRNKDMAIKLQAYVRSFSKRDKFRNRDSDSEKSEPNSPTTSTTDDILNNVNGGCNCAAT